MNIEYIEQNFIEKIKEDLRRVLREVEEDEKGGKGLDLGKYELAIRDMGRISKESLLETIIGNYGKGYKGSKLQCKCGEDLKYVGDRQIEIQTLIGKIKLKRSYYNGECGHSQIPLDEELGLRKRWSAKMQEIISLVGQEVSFECAAEMIYELSGIVVSDDSVERITEDAGERMMKEERRKETQAVIFPIKEEVERLYMAADGAKVPTREEWREVKLGAIFKAEKKGDELEVQEVTYFGGMINSNEFGEKWQRQGKIRGSEAAKEVVILGDGGSWIWNLAHEKFPESVQIVDWFHAKEYIYNVGRKLYGEGTKRAGEFAKKAEERLWEGDIGGVLSIIKDVKIKGEKAKQIKENACTYYGDNAHRMNYKKFREGGYLIGSGVIEGACKSIAGRRLKISGAKWRTDNVDRILHLRIYYASGWWKKFWESQRKCA